MLARSKPSLASASPVTGGQHGEIAGREQRRQQREGGEAVERRRRVEAFERQHGEAERAVARFADHVAVPVLRLQEAGEPAPPLAQERGERGRRVGVGEGAAEDSHLGALAARARLAVQAVDEFVILDQAARIEAADLAHRVGAEGGEGAGDQQQRIRARTRRSGRGNCGYIRSAGTSATPWRARRRDSAAPTRRRRRRARDPRRRRGGFRRSRRGRAGCRRRR